MQSALLRSALRFRQQQPARRIARVFSSANPAQQQESFLNGTSSGYAEQMYELYQEDPNAVHVSWKQYFDNTHEGVAFSESDYNNPTTAAASRTVNVSTIYCSSIYMCMCVDETRF